MFERNKHKQEPAKPAEKVVAPVFGIESEADVERLAGVMALEDAGVETFRHQYKRTHPTWTCNACGRVEADPHELGTRGCPGA